MTKILFLGVAAIAAATLAGCGGGGGSTTTTATPDTREGSVGEVPEIVAAAGVDANGAIASFAELNEGFANVRSDTTLQTVLPTTGNATYNGKLGFDVVGALPGGGNDVDASVAGDLTMNVSFVGNQPITGGVTDLIYADTDGNFDDIDGSLTITGGVTELVRSSGNLTGVISADAVGDLTVEQAGVARDVSVKLDLSGQFGGTNGQIPTAMQGFVVGDVEAAGVGGTGDLTLTVPNGRFAAELPGANILP